MQSLGGVIAGAVAIVIVVVLVTGNHSKQAVADPDSSTARSIAATVDNLLRGIPQQGSTLGNPQAPVTITEFGDLECPYCAQFATGSQARLIARDVRAGKVKLTYKSLETATGAGPDENLWPAQQAAAYAAGSQDRAWYYIELFYREQGAEGSGYATSSFEQSVARQVPGLDYARWSTDRFAPALAQQILDEGDQAERLGINATPTIIATGPRSQTRPLSSSAITYTQLQAMIRSVA
jgi:protein-disulfide isomerase